MEVLSEAGRWQKRRRKKKEMEGRMCEMKERYEILLKGGVCRYLAVGTFQWTEMRWKEKGKKISLKEVISGK